MRSAIGVLLLCASLGHFVPAQAADRTATPKELAEKIVGRSSDNKGIWTATDEGTIRHEQSGLVCKPLDPPFLALRRISTSRSLLGKGMDVSCMYDGLQALDVILVHAARVTQQETLDSAFERYRREFSSALPKNAKSLGPLPRYPGMKVPDEALQRSETFANNALGRPRFTTLMVSLVNEWIVELRGSFEVAQPRSEEQTVLIGTMISEVLWSSAVRAVGKDQSPWNSPEKAEDNEQVGPPPGNWTQQRDQVETFRVPSMCGRRAK